MRQFILIVIFVWVASFSEGKAQTRDRVIATNQVECESSTTHFRLAKAVVDSGYMDSSYSLRDEKAKMVEEISVETIKRPLFALKTNLLFDMATALNIELEVPMSKRFSVAGEWMFPWWLWEKQQHCLQVLSGNLEFRYWLKPNFKKQHQPSKEYNPLTGWFVGVYGGGGLYDIEWNKKGYQGEFYIAAGVSGGYVQPLSRSLSMEFSIGVGYLQTDYRRYESRFSNVDSKWHPIRQQNGSYTWVGPTKAKVSLIWCPYFKKRGGRR